jgi:hypothetical protein
LRIGTLQRACTLKRSSTLIRIRTLQWSGRSLLRTCLLLLALLVLLLSLQSLGHRSTSPADDRCSDQTLRLKCNFIHKSHPVPGSSGAIEITAKSRKPDPAEPEFPLSPTRICTQNTEIEARIQASNGAI